MDRITGRFTDGTAFILPSVVSQLSPTKREIIEKLADYEDKEEHSRESEENFMDNNITIGILQILNKERIKAFNNIQIAFDEDDKELKRVIFNTIVDVENKIIDVIHNEIR